MLFIDAANVSGGGAVLLQYLVEQLQQRRLPFFVLHKPGVELGLPENCMAEASVNLVNRRETLNRFVQRIQPSTVLCFGNFPLPFACKARTITYFHNPHYVHNHDYRNFNLRQRLDRYLRRQYLKFNLGNSDFFVVQTPFIGSAFEQTFHIDSQKVKVLPFYNQEEILRVKNEECLKEVTKVPGTFLYASSSEPHKNHENLLFAWEILYREGLSPTLYLTISPDSPYTTNRLLNRIRHLQEMGLAIHNLGNLPYTDLLRRTYSCTYCIFPSVNETLGLGLVEAYWMGNYILASQKPYLSYVVKPSDCFDPHDPNDIATKVRNSLTGVSAKPQLVIENKINAFINFLYL